MADHADGTAFTVDLTRQFIEASDEDPAMWQLSCTFFWPDSPATATLGGGSLWSFDMSLDEFSPAAAALPGWAWALETDQGPNPFDISFEQAKLPVGTTLHWTWLQAAPYVELRLPNGSRPYRSTKAEIMASSSFFSVRSATTFQATRRSRASASCQMCSPPLWL